MTAIGSAWRLLFARTVSARGAIARGAAWLLAGRLTAQALSVLFTVILARGLGVSGFGEYAYVAAIVYVANVATTFGTDMVLIRDVASGALARWRAALAIQLGLSTLAIVGAWIAEPFLPGLDPDGAGALRIFVLALVPAAVYSVSTAILRGERRMRAYAALGTASAGLQLGMLVVLALAGRHWLTVPATAAALVLSQGISAFAAWLLCIPAVAAPERRGRPVPAPHPVRTLLGEALAMLRASAPIGAIGWLGMFYQRLPVLVLASFSGPLATGWFAGATRIVEASKTGHVALLGAIYPAMADRRAPHLDGPLATGLPSDRDIDWWRRAYVGAAVLLSAVLVIGGPTLIGIFYGPAFVPASGALVVLALSVVPSTTSTFLSLELVAARREVGALRAQGLTLLALLGLSAGLVPALGWTGGAWAVLGAEGVQLAALLRERSRRPQPRADSDDPGPARVAPAATGIGAPSGAGGRVG